MTRNHQRWRTVSIRDSLKLINGRAFKPTEWKKTGRPIVRIQNLNNPEAPFNYFEGDLPEKFQLDEGDLLFAWSGTPGTSFGAHIWRGGKAWLNQHIFKIEFDEKQFEKKFLQLAINQNLAEYIRAAHGGAGLAHITKGRFEDSELPQPEIDEQREIVAEIEKQFTRLEAGVAALRRVQANLKRYRAAVLKAACEGKLVPIEAELQKSAGKDQKGFESGEELLKRVRAERRQHWTRRGKYKEPTAPDVANLPSLPNGWTWCMSDALFFFITSGSRGWAKYYSETGPLFLRIGNLDHENIRLDLSDLQHVKPPKGAEGVRTVVRGNDILVSITADVGMVGLVPDGLGEAYINQHVALARPLPSISPTYLAYYLCASEGGWGHFKKLQRGATKVGLGLDDIGAVPIPLPPLAEQTRIVAEVDRRLSVVEELESVVSANLQRTGRLRQSVLQQAFSGGLLAIENGGKGVTKWEKVGKSGKRWENVIRPANFSFMEILEIVAENYLGKSVLAHRSGLKSGLLKIGRKARASEGSPEEKKRISAIVELCFEYKRENDPDERKNILEALDEIVRNEPLELPTQSIEQWDEKLAVEDRDYRTLKSRDENRVQDFLKKYFSCKAKAGLKTQIEVAKAAGLGRTQVTVLESGEHMPQQKTLQKLAKAFEVDVTDLM